MKGKYWYSKFGLPFLFLFVCVIPANANVYIQCPLYALDAFGRPDPTQLLPAGFYAPTGITVLPPGVQYNPVTGNVEGSYTDVYGTHNVACKSLSAGDGHAYMADRDRTGANPDAGDIYTFGFDHVNVRPGQCVGSTCQGGYNAGAPCSSNSDCFEPIPTDQIMNMASDPTAPGGMLGTEISAPTLIMREGQEFYLSLTNVGMVQRPDLFDPHTVHYHGFPNAGSVFDGEPMASFGISMGETLTYYYNNIEPGTYMYHCHVEASEHMQMGMLGNLYVQPAQDNNAGLKNLGTPPYAGFAYNDGDGSTGYHVSKFIQITAFDPVFHHDDNSYNPLDFAGMNDTYGLLNGRGYPDTVLAGPINNIFGVVSQNTDARVVATKGQKILLRISSLATTEFNTLTLLGMPMQVVGQGARLLRGPDGKNLYYKTNSITLGGGEAMDVIIDTSTVDPGTYFLYTTNLHKLSNDAEDFGGIMTEIVIN